jgi:hypothetical protein
MKEKRVRVIQYFDTEIEQYVLQDLNRLSQIRPDPNTGLRGCTVPQAMLIFAVLDLLGYLVNEDPKASKKNTSKNYSAIFSSNLGLFPIQYEQDIDKIVKLFRHGLMHQFFPKASGIAKVIGDKPLIFPGSKNLCLNVDRLSADLVNAIRVLRQRIENGSNEANELVERINGRLDILIKEDFEELDKVCREAD